MMAASSSGMFGGMTCTRAVGGISMYSAIPPSATSRWKPKMWCTSHIQYLPVRQNLQRSHGTICSAITVSPAPTPKWAAASSPRSSTMPKNSCPGITGAFTHGLPPQNIAAPDQHLQSLAQMPQAEMRMTISRAFGIGRGTCSTR